MDKKQRRGGKIQGRDEQEGQKGMGEREKRIKERKKERKRDRQTEGGSYNKWVTK